MPQVVQTKCPHCNVILRMPAEWLGRSMRCKSCKNTFQTQAKLPPSTPTTALTPAPAVPGGSAPIAKPANAIQPAPVAAMPVPSTSGKHFDFSNQAHSVAYVAKSRTEGRGLLPLVMTFFVLFVLGASGAGFFIYKVISTSPDGPHKSDTALRPKDSPKHGKDTSQPTGRDKLSHDEKQEKPNLATKGNMPFPRRALLISVNNYLMFNAVHYGSEPDTFKGGYPGSSTGALRARLMLPPMHFPTSQVIELSDGVPPESKAGKAHPTQKVVLEAAIKDFVDTSREQDRVLIFFAGHAAYVGDKSYLIPIEGALENTESLIPLRWIYEQLARCKAQQRILILDVFRYSPGRGFELPGAGEGDEGTMPEGFDKDLQNPPPGVQVWCSCQKDQSAVELEGGSAFMQALCQSLLGGNEMKGIADPSQAIPVDSLVVKVNQRLTDLLTPEKRTQSSRLTGKARDGGDVLNPQEPLPPTLMLKLPLDEGSDRAGYAQVNKILDELKLLPPVRDTRVGELSLLTAQNLPPFSAKRLDTYKPDNYQNVVELLKRYHEGKGKTAFAKEFPLRAAVFDAVDALQESDRIQMREVLAGPINPKQKAAFLKEQAAPGLSIFKLEQMLATLKSAAEERDKETSKRWQANFDYTMARLQSRLVYLFEYSYTLGQIRADNLPELTEGQSGWRIGTGRRIAVTEPKAKALAKSTAKLWKRIQDEYPGTPWALLAQRESLIALGLQWRPKSD